MRPGDLMWDPGVCVCARARVCAAARLRSEAADLWTHTVSCCLQTSARDSMNRVRSCFFSPPVQPEAAVDNVHC